MPIESTEATFKLQDRTALMTGPCHTIHQAIALKLTQLGANVCFIDQNVDQLQRFSQQLMDAREINERYGRAHAVQVDLTKIEKVHDGISKAAEAFGGVDIFIDGMMANEAKPFKDPKGIDELDRLINTNLRIPILFTHGVLRFLEGRKRGRIIYLMQDIARLGFENNSLLAMTRSGLSAFVRTLSREVADKNITANCVALGLTEEFLLTQSEGASASIQDAQIQVKQLFPAAKMIEPEKAANTVAFLASPLGAGITGQTIAVSQGLSFLS
jgi:2-hydroxycyclohexanecarboxyl-CoA dehydrogenase